MADKPKQPKQSKRDFLYLTAGATAAAGAAAMGWAFIDTMNPAADTLALASTEVNISQIEPGQSVTVMWRGKPVFIRRRTEAEVKEAEEADLSSLRDPQSDDDRTEEGHREWLVVVGVCTHLGCVPLGQKPAELKGDFGGWFCPCHGSHYDTSGRIRKGPAPKNLLVPDYSFINENVVKIG